jgi:hypothetical protein
MNAAIKKRRDADVTQQIRTARDELDKAVQASKEAHERLCSTLPPKTPVSDEEGEDTEVE